MGWLRRGKTHKLELGDQELYTQVRDPKAIYMQDGDTLTFTYALKFSMPITVSGYLNTKILEEDMNVHVARLIAEYVDQQLRESK